MEVVDAAIDAIAALPIVGAECVLEATGKGDYSHWLAVSRRGIFAYDWDMKSRSSTRLTCPSVPVSTNQLPGGIQDAAGLVRLQCCFVSEPTIEIEYVEPPEE